MARHVVAALADFPPGTRRLIEISGRKIAVFNVKGEFFAIFNRCPHEGGSMFHGQLVGLIESSSPGEYKYSRQDEIIRCPWHSWEFDLRTGKSWCDPNRVKVRNYNVKVEPGATVVEGPYVAETFPVTIEDDYVIVEA
ncbi:MAG TPA: Rieske (2Fe-2S) protein [Xanthobacteraceae bacterium]|nr:Rieske (2Fe-2S) protein [Xanthobacteraceae bacterium]